MFRMDMDDRRVLCKWAVITAVIVVTATLPLTEATNSELNRRSRNRTLLSPVIFGEYLELP